jgi:hypothetical protein
LSEKDKFEPDKDAEKCEAEKKEEKSKRIFQIDIDLEKLAQPHNAETPENQAIWENRKEMSDEYLKMSHELQILALYMAKCCNEGPEVKDNVNKRLVLVRLLLGMLLDNLAITGYDAYGMLLELLMDTYMKVSGRRHMLSTIAQVMKIQDELNKEKSASYAT